MSLLTLSTHRYYLPQGPLVINAVDVHDCYVFKSPASLKGCLLIEGERGCIGLLFRKGENKLGSTCEIFLIWNMRA